MFHFRGQGGTMDDGPWPLCRPEPATFFENYLQKKTIGNDKITEITKKVHELGNNCL